MSTLYELKGNYLLLLDLMMEDDVDDELISDTMEAVEGEIAHKLECYKIIDAELEAEAEKLDKEIKRMSSIKAKLIKNREKLKDSMTEIVSLLPDQMIKSEHYQFKLVGKGGKAPLVIKEGAVIPDEFLKVITEPDNEKIREGIASGVVDFAYLGERGTRLSIK